MRRSSTPRGRDLRIPLPSCQRRLRPTHRQSYLFVALEVRYAKPVVRSPVYAWWLVYSVEVCIQSRMMRCLVPGLVSPRTSRRGLAVEIHDIMYVMCHVHGVG